jgi:serine/threonine protein kinase
MFHEGDILCSKYKLKKRFDEGGFSSVWLAEDLETQENLALKVYESIEDMEAFKKGFKLVYRLTHSNIFTPLAYYVHNGVPFLVMSYCPNGSAKSKIGRMTEDDVWKFAHDVAAGLAYLHDTKHIVHQDIKPGNILIDDDGKYMITDFDISTRQKGTKRMTERQVQEMQDFNYGCGTPDYMGPERWPDSNMNYKPSLIPSQASDIWSLGATLFELMEGHVPFGETGGAYQRNLCKDLTPSNRKRNAVPKIAGNYSKELRKLVYMCLAKDAWDRPSAKQIAESAVHHKSPTPHSSPSPPWIKYVVSCTTAIVVVLGAYLLWPSGGSEKKITFNLNDSIYSSYIGDATELIKSQSELSNGDESYMFDIEKVSKAYALYEQADTMSDVSDSLKEKGREQWSASQEIIEKEYQRMASEEQRYTRMDAPSAAEKFKQQRENLEKYAKYLEKYATVNK